ncbi:MAG: DUF4038 domain-containing protein [Planctomycetota bacterium]
MRLTAALLPVVFCLPFPAAAATVHVWESVEITLSAASASAEPWPNMQVWVDLEGPGFSQRCYGFWDGGNTYRVRVQANAPGTWNWRSGSEPEDAGLAGKSGRFEAAAWTDAEKQANANRRGQVAIATGGRYFHYADGTPVLLLADTLWAGNTARCGLGRNEDGPFFRYLADRRQKGFNTVLMEFIHGYGDYPDGQGHRNEGGYALLNRDPAQLNPAYFQALDRRMKAITEQGFVAAVPFTWWGKTKRCVFTPDQARRISAYCAARYGTFNAIWSLSGEYQYAFGDCGWEPRDFTRMGAEVQRHNPLRHPLSIHPSGQTRWKPPHNNQSSSPFHGESWIDHHWLQTGQSLDRLYNIATRLEENRALKPAVPIFCSEAYYDRATDAESTYHSRWQVWAALLNGAAGYGYGVMGMWQFYDPADPKGETGKVQSFAVPWTEAIEFQGSAQVGHAHKLLMGLKWWNLKPQRDALLVDGKQNPMPTASDITPPHAAKIGDATWVVYLPRGHATRSIALPREGAAAATARWFDPRRGEHAGKPTELTRETWVLPPRPSPADEDWVCVIKRSP